MRLSTRHFAALAAAGALALTTALPADAGTAHSISVSPTTVRPGETTTVTGTSDCASVAYTVTLTYTNPAGDTATTTATGTTDASGEYTQALTAPENAVAEEPASVQSSADCSGGAAASNSVNLTIQAHEGTFTISQAFGSPGTQVSFSGANCYGNDVAVVFTDSEFDAFVEAEATLNQDRTFSGTFTIPADAGPGEYFFVAECPGTDFPERPFTVVAGQSTTPPVSDPTPAPPAPPVVGVVDFTG